MTQEAGPISLLSSRSHDLKVVLYATGCIFEYDGKHPEGSGVGFTEEEGANFFGSYYSRTKGMVSTE